MADKNPTGGAFNEGVVFTPDGRPSHRCYMHTGGKFSIRWYCTLPTPWIDAKVGVHGPELAR